MIIVTVFTVILQILAWLLVALLVVAALLVVPRIRLRVSGSVRLEGDPVEPALWQFVRIVEAWAKGEGLGQQGRHCEVHPGSDSDTEDFMSLLAPVDDEDSDTFRFRGKVALDVSAVGGALSVSYSPELGTRARLVGFPVRLKTSDKRSQSPTVGGMPKFKLGGKRGNKSRSGEGRSVRPIDGIRLLDRISKKPVRKRILKALKEIFGSFHLEGSINSEIGLENPAATGILYGQYHVIRRWSGSKWFTVRPNFQRQVLSSDGWVQIEFSLARLALVAAKFALSSEIRSLWMKKRRRSEGGKAVVFPGRVNRQVTGI